MPGCVEERVTMKSYCQSGEDMFEKEKDKNDMEIGETETFSFLACTKLGWFYF